MSDVPASEPSRKDTPSSPDWFARNLAAIESRLAFLRDLPDGAIHERPGSLHNLVVWKKGTFLELHFHGGKAQNAVMEVISDLDFARPLYLVAGFTQAMMLGLLWEPEPQRVYVLGFGAGRVPMVLHHHFPQVHVESAEIDPDVIAVARTHFGIQSDDRFKVAAQEGRAYLARRDAAVRYDIIMVDAFRGVGFSPYQLATKEFYQLCKDHLSPGGVFVVNWMRTDFLLISKIRTLVESFTSVLAVPVPRDGTVVLFASDVAADPARFAVRAEELQARHGFASPFVTIAQRLADVKSLPEYAPYLSQARMLRDGDAPPAPPPPAPAAQQARVGRNDPCPCGSGKKYKKCHGQVRVE